MNAGLLVCYVLLLRFQMLHGGVHKFQLLLRGTGQLLDSFQHLLGQMCIRDRVVLLCGLNQAVDHSAGLGAGRGVGKEPVLPAHDEWLNAALGTVVGEFQPAVLQIAYQIGPLLPQIPP